MRDPIENVSLLQKQITDEMANLFYARFWGRQDVYAKRSEKRGTGEAGYYTQCHNRWLEICPKMHHQKISCIDCPHQAYKKLTKRDILLHLQGRDDHGSDVIGIYPLLKNGTCRFLVYDFDHHGIGVEQVNLKSFKYYDRMLPAQDALKEGGLGNLIALPLQGRALQSGNSAFIDSHWNAYPNQWEILLSKPRLSAEFMEAKIKEWTGITLRELYDEDGEVSDREKPMACGIQKSGFL